MKKGILAPVGAIVIAALVLAGANFGLKEVAQKKAEDKRLWLMQTILPESESFVEEEYTGEDANIRSVHKAENGYVVETNVYGYAGEITMLVGVNNNGKVTGMVVTDLSETYGLGANALTDHAFLAQFLNQNGEMAITTGEDAFSSATQTGDSENSTYVDGITGATVTSKAIAKSINSAVAFITGADVESGATSWGG